MVIAMYIATFLLLCAPCLFQATFCSDNNKDPLLDPNSYEHAERQIRYSVLAEPCATHPNPRAWREGLDLHTIAAIPYVSKHWNSVYKEIIGKPRNEIIETCRKKLRGVTLSKPSILFNQYGDMFCLKTNENLSILATNGRFYALKTFIYDVIEKFKTDYTKNPKNYNVSSCAASYTNEYGQFIEDAVFITQISEYSDMCTLIFPTLKNEHLFVFCATKKDTLHISEKYISALHETLPKIIKKMCAAFHEKDSMGNDFWNANFNNHAICKRYNSQLIDIYITDDYFNDVRQHWDFLTATPVYYDMVSCSCSSAYICHDCNERYLKVCTILEYEHALNLKSEFLKSFAQKHILHKITEHNGITIYATPFGGHFKKDAQQKITQIMPGRAPENLCYDLDTLKAAAQGNALEWHTAEKPLLSYTCSNVTMPSPQGAVSKALFELLLLKQEEIGLKIAEINIDDLKNITIEKSVALQYNNIPIIIAKLRADGSDNPILYFYNTQCCKENLRESHSETKYDLEKIFKTVLSLADQGHSCAINAPNDVIDNFVAYVEKLQPALTAIPEEINHYKLIEARDLENSSHLYCYAEDFAEKLNIITFGSNNFCFHKQNNRLQCVYFNRQNASISNRDFAIMVEPDETILHANEYNPFSYSPHYYIFLLRNLCNREKRIIFWKDLQFRENQQENPNLKHITLEPNTMPTYCCGSSEELEKIFAVFSNTWNKPFECVIQITNENALTFIKKIKISFEASSLAHGARKLKLTDADIVPLKLGYIPPATMPSIPQEITSPVPSAIQDSGNNQPLMVSNTNTHALTLPQPWELPQLIMSAWYLITRMPFLFKKF